MMTAPATDRANRDAAALKLYEGLTDGGDRSRDAIERRLCENGLAIDDPRLRDLGALMHRYAKSVDIPFAAIAPALGGANQTLLSRALTGNL